MEKELIIIKSDEATPGLEEAMTEKTAAALVAGAFFVGSLIAGTKIRAALLALLAPVLIVFALPHVWKHSVMFIKKRARRT